MRVVAYILVVVVSLGPSGCGLFKKQQAPAQPAADPLFPRADRTSAPAGGLARGGSGGEGSPVIPTSGSSGLLAGQVIDSFSNPVRDAYILVSFPKQGGQSDKKPIDVACNPQGYFTISGLEAGRHYQLQARARDGNRMVAGTTWATPPNPRVLIRVSEDFVTKNTPPIPPPPDWPGARERKEVAQADTPQAKGTSLPDRIPPAAADRGWTPGRPIVVNPRPEPKETSPNGGEQTRTNDPPVRTEHPENIARGNDSVAKDFGRPAFIPAVPRTQSRPADTAPPAAPAATRVPSCVLVGDQLVNFALYDLDDRPWEYRQRTGKVVLLDFWSTNCIPCRATIPHLNILQANYGSAGLQVIGIACESEGTHPQKRRRVDRTCQVMQVRYKVLLDGEDYPVMTQFRVRNVPTLVLLDPHGWVIWKHVGSLDPEALRDLDIRLRNYLGLPNR